MPKLIEHSDAVFDQNLIKNFNHVHFNSTQITQGDLFVAIKGFKNDGANFIADALKKGAKGLVAQPKIIDIWAHQKNTFEYLFKVAEPRLALSRLAALYYPEQVKNQIAVTGTNGKTSIVHYLRQIWEFLGYKSATIGTVGDNQHSFSLGGLTTPPPTDLHLGIERIAKSGFTHLGVEASSHGISQYRLDAMMLKGAAFSNLSQDHLDYHQSLSQYWEAKRGLFSRVLQPGGFIVFPLGCQQSNDLTKLSKQRQLRCFAWDMNDANSRYDHAVINATLNQDGIGARLRLGGVEKQVVLKLYGAFQLENLMTAMLCAYALESSHLNQHALNEKATRILSCLDQIKPVVGRMQLAAKCINGALVVVDYAHTPDALKNALIALKKHFDQTGIKNNIAVMFGCGGNRDRLKRAQMGKIANEFADFVIVSDDNPRDEDPSAIRKEIMKECPKGIEVAGRREGIYQALKLLKDHDVLLIAGKGHEKIQIIGKNEIVFDDLETAKEMVALLDLKQ